MRWEYTNPVNRDVSLGDCVARSCSIAMKRDYWDTRAELDTLANIERTIGKQKRSDVDRSVNGRVIHAYLILNNWHYYRAKTWKQVPIKGTVIVSLRNHLVTVVNGVAKDTWDSTKRRRVLGYYKRG